MDYRLVKEVNDLAYRNALNNFEIFENDLNSSSSSEISSKLYKFFPLFSIIFNFLFFGVSGEGRWVGCVPFRQNSNSTFPNWPGFQFALSHFAIS